jgi:soluble lytic murein transglycosylase
MQSSNYHSPPSARPAFSKMMPGAPYGRPQPMFFRFKNLAGFIGSGSGAAVLLVIGVICACSSTSKKQSLLTTAVSSVATPSARLQNPPSNEKPMNAGLAPSPVPSSAPSPVPSSATVNKIALLKTTDKDAKILLAKYSEAQSLNGPNSARACQLWLELGRESGFPLASLAQIHALENCAGDGSQSEVREYFAKTTEMQIPWLREAAVRAGATYAGKTPTLKPQEIKLTIEMAASEPLQSEQLRMLQKAQSLANDLTDKTNLDITVETIAQQIEKIAPRFIKKPKADQFLAVGNDYRKARNFKKSREFYQKVLRSGVMSDLEKLRALDGIRMTFKLEQKFDLFIKATRDYARFARKKFFKNQIGKHVEAQLVLARAIWTEGSPAEATKILIKLEKEIQGKSPLTESLFVRARIAEEAGKLPEALAILAKINEKQIADRTLRRKIWWSHVWMQRKSGDLKGAAARLTDLISEEEDTPPLASRDHFWLGKILQDSNDKENAQVQFEWLTQNDPLGYYGLLAQRELKRPMPAIGRNASQSTTHSSLDETDATTFDWLIATNESDLAKKFLDQAGLVHRNSWTEEQTLDYFQLYAKAGAYQALFGKLNELTPQMRAQILEQNPDLLFPRPWLPIVNKAAEKNSLPPELVFSIMRQESSFNPLSHSSADAFGLMQLIPQVAESSAAAVGVTYHQPDDLYQPETNIQLGSSHLKTLLQRWKGLFVPAVASYNASERAVHGWLKTRDRNDSLQFIEDIPYEETKGYVKLVMRNFIFYSRLSTTEKTIPFPEWCLNGLQSYKP